MNKFKCCFCGKEFTGYGNNPDCWDDKEWAAEDRCCDKCNEQVVIPARMKVMFSNKTSFVD